MSALAKDSPQRAYSRTVVTTATVAAVVVIAVVVVELVVVLVRFVPLRAGADGGPAGRAPTRAKSCRPAGAGVAVAAARDGRGGPYRRTAVGSATGTV